MMSRVACDDRLGAAGTQARTKRHERIACYHGQRLDHNPSSKTVWTDC